MNMQQVRLITWNCNGLDKTLKLAKFLQRILKKIPTQHTALIICLQEIKTESLNRQIEQLLTFHGFKFHFHPSIKRSGGLLTAWSGLNQATILYQQEVCLISHFPELDLVTMNTYIKTCEYSTYIQKLCELSTNLLKTHENDWIVLLGDLNAYKSTKHSRSGQPCQAVIKKDLHVQIFNRLRPILDNLLLSDIAEYLDEESFTHYCKKTKTQTRLDYVFSNRTDSAQSLSTYLDELSDHRTLEVIFEIRPTPEIGPGTWKLNNNILLNNGKLIKEEIERTFSSSLNYDANKQRLREILRSACINKRRMEESYQTTLEQAIQQAVSTEEKQSYAQLLADFEKQQCQEIIKTMKASFHEICEGNPKEIKCWINKCQPKTLINKLETSEGEILTGSDEMLTELYKFYKCLYKNEHVRASKIFCEENPTGSD